MSSFNASSATRTILIATGNPGKFRELSEILTAVLPHVQWMSLNQLPQQIPEPEETGATCAENARLKALYYAKAAGHWTIADDSGLEVDALNGAPGVYSARFAGTPSDQPREIADRANNAKLVALLRDVPSDQRSARFRCALALAGDDRILVECNGTVEGRIIDEPRGEGGFGYDPYFFIDELGCTTSELSQDHKNRISHRGRATRALAQRLAGFRE